MMHRLYMEFLYGVDLIIINLMISGRLKPLLDNSVGIQDHTIGEPLLRQNFKELMESIINSSSISRIQQIFTVS